MTGRSAPNVPGSSAEPPSPTSRTKLREGPFIALMAALMTMTAMTIDINLPAIPETAAALGASLTRGQLTVPLFFLGFAMGQLLWGPAADQLGRRPLLLRGILLFVLTSLACTGAQTMDQLLALRVVQGFAAGAGSILARVMIRDLFEGAQMARVMSLALAAFIMAPIVAPIIGAGLLEIGSWRLIFGFLTLYGSVILLLGWHFVPESLDPRDRAAFGLARIAAGYRAVFGDRHSRRMALTSICAFTPLTIYLANAPAVFMEGYGMGPGEFAAVFAAIAVCAAFGNLANARLVRRHALHVVLRAGLAGGAAATATALLAALSGLGSGWALVPGLAFFFFSFGFTAANSNALALLPHGAIAGIATSAVGVAQTIVPALVAATIATCFDGTARPMLLAMTASLLIGLGLVITGRRSASAV